MFVGQLKGIEKDIPLAVPWAMGGPNCVRGKLIMAQ